MPSETVTTLTHLVQNRPDWRTAAYVCGATVGDWTREERDVTCEPCDHGAGLPNRPDQ